MFNVTLPLSVEIKQKGSNSNDLNSGINNVSGVNTSNSENKNNSAGFISRRENINYDDSRKNILDLTTGDKLDLASSSLLRDLSNNEIVTNNNIKLDDSFDISVDNSADSNLISEEQNVIENEQKLAQSETKVLISGAGLMYSYKFEALYLRFSNAEANSVGSEHQIDSHSYAAEIQLMSYNSVLYKSFAEAMSKPQGLLGIAIMVDLIREEVDSTNGGSVINRRKLNEPLEVLLSNLDSIKHRGFSVEVRDFNLSALIPDSNNFVIYEGSLTTPGCDESVNWLVLNKPLYISRSKVSKIFRFLALKTAKVVALYCVNILPIYILNWQ